MAQASKRRPEALQISDAGALAKSCWTLRTLQCDRLRRCLLCAKSVRRSARASMRLVDIQAAPERRESPSSGRRFAYRFFHATLSELFKRNDLEG